jgi:hypothetical protein
MQMAGECTLWLLLLALQLACVAEERDEPALATEGEIPRLRRVGPGLYRMGKLSLDARRREIRFRGLVNMDEGGPIELLACLPTGKTHESVLACPVEPLDLQTALLLLRFTPGRNPAVDYKEDSTERESPPGSPLRLFVEWRPEQTEDAGGTAQKDGGDESKQRRVRAEALLLNVETEKPVDAGAWVFLGSRFVRDQFGADLEGSLISTYHDPLAIVELATEEVNDDIFYAVNADLCPPVGTPVEVIIQPVPKKKPRPGDEPGPKGQSDDQPDEEEEADAQE